jgi:hypothetical protein
MFFVRCNILCTQAAHPQTMYMHAGGRLNFSEKAPNRALRSDLTRHGFRFTLARVCLMPFREQQLMARLNNLSRRRSFYFSPVLEIFSALGSFARIFKSVPLDARATLQTGCLCLHIDKSCLEVYRANDLHRKEFKAGNFAHESSTPARREMDFLEVSDPLKGPALALSPQNGEKKRRQKTLLAISLLMMIGEGIKVETQERG